MTVWVTQYERAAIVIMAAILVMVLYEKRIASKISNYYTLVLVCSFFAAILDQIGVVTLNHASEIPLFTNYVINMLYIVMSNMVYMFYLLYVISATKLDYKLTGFQKNLLLIPADISLVVVLSTPYTGWAFRITEDFRYVHGSGFYVQYVVALIYLTMGFIISITEKDYVSRLQRVAFVSFFILAVIGGILSVIFPYVLLNALITVVGLILVYISMQNQLVDSDNRLGTYNEQALLKYLDRTMKNGKDFYMITLKVGNLKHMNVTHGFDVTNGIVKQIADYMLSNTPSQKVFLLSGTLLSAYIEGDREGADSYAKKLEERMLRNFRSEGLKNEASLPFSINIIHLPEMGNDAKEVIDLINYSIYEPSALDVEHIYYVSNETAEKKKRISAVEKVMEMAIRNGNLEVYYQPIINLETGKSDSAEALVRIIDEELGEISPAEFIPIAVGNGGIVQITEIVLRRVCSFMKEGRLEEAGIKHIEINLSETDWTMPNLIGRIMPIINTYGVDPSKIVFEITEKCKYLEGNNVAVNIKEINDAGFGIALDNYGLNQLNTNSLLKQQLKEVKIDKAIFWNLYGNSNSSQILEMYISLLKQSGFEVVVSGVESMEQDDYLIDIGCPYSQGYNYAKPLPEKDFVDYLSSSADDF